MTLSANFDKPMPDLAILLLFDLLSNTSFG